jgi:hypothetical protein
MELCLNHIEEDDTIVAMVLIFILGVEVIPLTKVVLWRVGVVISSDPTQIGLATSVAIGVNVYWFVIGISPLLLILYNEAALNV